MKANHRANVVVVGDILPHPTADRLELTYVEGYQIVIGKGGLKKGDLAVYIQPDSVVPQTEAFRFIWGDHVGIDGIVPERRRRITVKRLRREYSEGLLMPLGDLIPEFVGSVVPHADNWIGVYRRDGGTLRIEVGQDLAELIGVTHYIPEFDRENTQADRTAMPRRRYPKSVRGWFFWTLSKLGIRWGDRALALEVAFDYPVYDVDALKNHKKWIQDGDRISVTEKIHGSNGRYVFIDGVQYCGSREQWKKEGGNVWWNVFKAYPSIGEWCQQNPGKVLYGEVGPTQKDKQDSRGWRYGAEEGETFFFAFDVWDPQAQTWSWAGDAGFAPTVPTISVQAFNSDVLKMAEGNSVVPGHTHHHREGIVLRKLDGSGITLKVVSNKFLETDAR